MSNLTGINVEEGSAAMTIWWGIVFTLTGILAPIGIPMIIRGIRRVHRESRELRESQDIEREMSPKERDDLAILREGGMNTDGCTCEKCHWVSDYACGNLCPYCYYEKVTGSLPDHWEPGTFGNRFGEYAQYETPMTLPPLPTGGNIEDWTEEQQVCLQTSLSGLTSDQRSEVMAWQDKAMQASWKACEEGWDEVNRGLERLQTMAANLLVKQAGGVSNNNVPELCFACRQTFSQPDLHVVWCPHFSQMTLEQQRYVQAIHRH
jgi:hypothetical protein